MFHFLFLLLRALKIPWKLLEYEFLYENYESETNKMLWFQWCNDKIILDHALFTYLLASI